MALVVQKYGGTSVGSIDKIRSVAKKIAKRAKGGDSIVVVVSAMGHETDRLVKLAHQISETPSGREYDVLFASGEQVSVSLMTMALNNLGINAISMLGHQAKIYTDSIYSKAMIERIDTARLRKALSEKKIVVVAGCQGVDTEENITTLGRGGSDLTAVALAAALECPCEIYTDVEGVYSADPNVVPSARKLERISYEEMLELAAAGAKVLHIRAVKMAMRYHVPLVVRSTFSENDGTLVTEEERGMEKYSVSGVTCDTSEIRMSLVRVPDTPGVAGLIFDKISSANIIVDMIIQNASDTTGHTDVSFTLPKEDEKKALEILQSLREQFPKSEVSIEENIAKISVVGAGMKTHSGVAAKMFRTLADEGINIKMISTSEIKISCVVDSKYAELAVRSLHDAFELDKAFA
ncbi:aspartate kinase [Bdellovibrionota bacterium]